jgi:hypothetical protein
MLQQRTGREAEFRDLAARASGQPAPPLIGNRHFWRSDVMTHHRPGYEGYVGKTRWRIIPGIW